MPDSIKRLAIIEELGITRQILDEGLNSLDRIDFAKDHYYVVFHLIANGLERLLKATIILGLHQRLGRFPTVSELTWKKGAGGHRLEPLIDQLEVNCFSREWKISQKGRADLDYLKKDILFRKVLKIISDFGVSLRYANINIITGDDSTQDPNQVWGKMELDLFLLFDPELETLKKPDPEKSRIVYAKVIQLLSDSIRQGIAVIARLYTLGELSSLARQASPLLSGYFQFDKDSVFNEGPRS